MIWTNANNTGMRYEDAGLSLWSGGTKAVISKPTYQILNNARSSSSMPKAQIYTGGTQNNDKFCVTYLNSRAAEGTRTYGLSDIKGLGKSLTDVFADTEEAIKPIAYIPEGDSFNVYNADGTAVRKYDNSRIEGQTHVGLDLEAFAAAYPRLVVMDEEVNKPAHLDDNACLSVLLAGLKLAFARIAELESKIEEASN